MKINSRATNLRHLQDALAALSWAASVARTSPLDTPPALPPSSLERDVLAAASRALRLGATPREVAGASLRSLDWVTTAQYSARLDTRDRARQASL